MDNGPLISVIVPVYKTEKYLRKCVDSIINQTYKNLEIILVDDGSPDNSGAICDKYAQKDERVKVIHKENGGVSDARNAGIKAAKGEYLGFVDSDDWIELDLYSDLASCIRLNADVIIYNLKYLDEAGRIVKASPYLPEGYLYINNKDMKMLRLLTENSLLGYVWNKLWKKELIQKEIFLDLMTREDICFMYKILDKINFIYCLNVYGYNYIQRNESLLHMGNVRNIETLGVVNKVISVGIERLSKKNNQILYNIIMQNLCIDIVIKDILRNRQISSNKKNKLLNNILNNREMIRRFKLRYCSNKLYAFVVCCLKLRKYKFLYFLNIKSK